MRIEKIEAIAISIPLKKDFGGSTYHVTRRCTIITRIHAGGLVSEVYNGDNRDHGAEIVRLIHEALAPLVIGEDIFATERIWEKMFALTHTSGNKKLLLEAIACVDCAVWDLVGKAHGCSVRQLLGGHRTRLPIISIGGYYIEGKTLADYGREMESYRRAGMAGCKFKVGGLSPEEDAKRVEAARKAAGDDFIIVVDANRGWNVQDAIRFARLVEPLNIGWFEELARRTRSSPSRMTVTTLAISSRKPEFDSASDVLVMSPPLNGSTDRRSHQTYIFWWTRRTN